MRSPERGNARALVLDFDGTVTEDDVLEQFTPVFGDPVVFAEAEQGLQEGRLTLHDVLRAEFAPVRAPLDDAVRWIVERARVRPAFRELVEFAVARGWRVAVVSSGFAELIEPVLEREGVAGVEIVANSVDADAGGWRIRFHDDDACGTCGEPCKRATVAALAEGREVVYVGDGYSDRCAAGRADRVFATRGLAAYLSERGVPFERFEDFHHVIRQLDGAPE